MGVSHTELLVLGVGHLTDRVRDAALAPAIDRLAAWRPDVIAVELLPGELVDAYIREGGVYDLVHVGGIDAAREMGTVGRRHRDWSRPEAARIARATDTTPTDRVLAWMVALEPWNAVLAADHASGGRDLPRDVRKVLAALAAGAGEVARVAVPLARRLGHDRLHHFDDHTGLECLDLAGADWWEHLDAAGLPAMTGALLRDLPRSEEFVEDIWPHWRSFNEQPAIARSEEVESGVLVGLTEAFPVNRIRLAQWRARNLFMAARLRTCTAYAPGGRVLAIVGQAHRGPLRAALTVDQHDLRLVDLAEL